MERRKHLTRTQRTRRERRASRPERRAARTSGQEALLATTAGNRCVNPTPLVQGARVPCAAVLLSGRELLRSRLWGCGHARAVATFFCLRGVRLVHVAGVRVVQ
jgi:hypothetical protein